MKGIKENHPDPKACSLKDKIIQSIEDHRQFEKLYRDNKLIFKREFNAIYPALQSSSTAKVWYERLNFDHEGISWGTRKEIIFVIFASLIAAAIAKIPDLTGIDPEYFFQRNIAFVVFPLLTAYFAWKQQLPLKSTLPVAVAIALSVVYINFLPDNSRSDTLLLACAHLPVFLWVVLGYTFVGARLNSYLHRLDYLRYNGDLIVMTGLILIAGGLVTGITFGLFELIGFNIETFYFRYIVISALAAAPLIGTYLVQTNPQLVNKVSPVIAKVFTPIVLLTLLVYIGAVIYTGKDPYNNRDFLLIFNLLLIGVMAIIFFSVAEVSTSTGSKTGIILLTALSITTIIVNSIALSAIIFRISEWGITPNRLAVLGANMLMLTNLLVVAYKLCRAVRNSTEIENVEKCISSFLPVYGIWTMMVTFLFPVLFGFK